MNFWQDKSVLVAGGAGFVGLHLVRALLDAKATVHVVDNFCTGQRSALAALQSRYGNQLSSIEQDISIASSLPKADVIFNLASPASPVHYQADPIGTWKSNVLGTLNLLDHMTALDAILVHASTSEVYGDPLHHPQLETDWGHVNPIGPRACYDESKRAAEALLMDAVRMKNADVRIGRLFNTYGPGMDAKDGRAIPNFVSQAKSGQPLTIHGDGNQTRSLCYVSDTVTGLMRLGENPIARGEVFNIGNPVEMTINTIAKTVNAAFGNTSEIVFEARPTDDPQRRCPDISKAKRLLDWAPTVSLEQGLAQIKETQPKIAAA